MKKTLAIAGILLMTTVAGAQDARKARGQATSNDPYTGKPQPKGAEHPMTNPNSNAPGSLDRDHGRDRAEDVGKGKKKGLKKAHHRATPPAKS